MIKRFNKKGFTLIELLAVIVVLAIIMLLAVQAVLPQMEKARKNAFVVEANAAIEAAQNFVLTKQISDSAFTISSSGDCVTISTLKDKGYYDTSGKNNYNGYVKITRSADGSSYTYKVYITNGQYMVNPNSGSKASYDDVKTGQETLSPSTGDCAKTYTNDGKE